MCRVCEHKQWKSNKMSLPTCNKNWIYCVMNINSEQLHTQMEKKKKERSEHTQTHECNAAPLSKSFAVNKRTEK